MANSKRRCKQCGEHTPDFIRFPVGTFCKGDKCVDEFLRAAWKARRAKNLKKARIGTKKQVKANRKKHRADKERVKPKSQWLKELQALVNRYVRLRDVQGGCISCDKPNTWGGQWHASHYYSRGHSSALRYNLWNIHKSCQPCNAHLSGNIGNYTPRLLKKIGQYRFDWLEVNKGKATSYDVEWLKRAIKVARKAVKRLEGRQT